MAVLLDLKPWRQAFIACATGAVSMAMLACAVVLARDTTGQEWYAASRLTVAELLIAVGFDENAPVEYSDADGTVETVSRYALTFDLKARWAREDILAAAWDGAMLGALSGFGGALLCLVLVWRTSGERRSWRPAGEPASPARRVEAQHVLTPVKDEPDDGQDKRSAPIRRDQRKRDYGRWI